MALINCPECNKQISDHSAHCLHCGYPIAAGDATVSQESAVTTQQTAKLFKAGMAIGAICFWIGVIAAIKGNWDVGVSFGFIGILLYAGSRTSAWWHNG